MTTTEPMSSPTAEPGADIAFPKVQMNVVRPTQPVIGRIVKNEICTASRKAAGFVRHVEVDVSGTPLAGSFRAGQSFGVIPPGTNEKGKPHAVRLYSIACPTWGEDGEGNVVSTTVKRTIDEHWDDHSLFLGVTSNLLCDAQEGDEIQVSGPNGKRFLLPENVDDHDYLFLATGTGIAPFRGMLHELLARECKSQVTLAMGAPYRTDLLYHDHFLRLEEEHDCFSYMTAISRERDDDGRPGMYVHQRLAAERERILPMLDRERTLIYVCGIAGMEVGLFQELARLLSGDALRQYMQAEPATLAQMGEWTRKTIGREVKPTRRVMLEVY